MPRTVEHIVECHRIARERRDAGHRTWDRTIDIKAILRRDKSNFSNKHVVSVAIEIADLLRSKVPKSWLDITSDLYEHELDDVVERLAGFGAEDAPEGELVAELNFALEELFDWADIKRVSLG